MPRRNGTKRTRAAKRRRLFLMALLIVALDITILFVLPIFPSITITFRLEASPIPYGAPVILVDAWSYEKLSLANSATIQKGQVTIIGYTSSGNQTKYPVFVDVKYGNRTLTPHTEVFMVAGSYQLRTVFQPLNEQSNIPYSFVFTTQGRNGTTLVLVTVNIFVL